MTDYRDRLIDNLLEETLGGQDHAQRIDAVLRAARREQDCEFDRSSPTECAVTESSWQRSLRRDRALPVLAGSVIAIVATFLIVLLAIGWMRTDGKVATDDDPGKPDGVNRDATPEVLGGFHHQLLPLQPRLVRHEGFVAPASTRASKRAGVPVLEQGWVYATGDSKTFLVGNTRLELVNARAVVVAGDVPGPYEVVAMSRMLSESELVSTKEDLYMLMNVKNWVSGLGVCICLLTGHAHVDAQTVASEQGKAEITINDVFAKYDANKNGKLDAEECVCKGSKMCDVNKDGVVTKEEFLKGIAEHCGSHEAAIEMINQLGGLDKFYTMAKNGELEKVLDVSMDKVFAQWDRNGNGTLEPEECVCKGSKMADADGDGVVTRQEMNAVAEKHFGSIDKFLAMVRQRGGIEAFYNEVATDSCSMGAVFARYDKNKNGSLEPSECICAGTKMSDHNKDGKVTREEMMETAKQMFGSVEKFEAFVKENGGAEKFYAAAAAGTLKAEKGDK